LFLSFKSLIKLHGNIINAYDEIILKANAVNAASALTDGSTITVTGPKHTLTTTQAAITYTLSQPEDFSTWWVTFNQTSAVWTFPAGALCKVNGVPSGNNTASISGVSGDKLTVSIFNAGSGVYSVYISNNGQ